MGFGYYVDLQLFLRRGWGLGTTSIFTIVFPSPACAPSLSLSLSLSLPLSRSLARSPYKRIYALGLVQHENRRTSVGFSVGSQLPSQRDAFPSETLKQSIVWEFHNLKGRSRPKIHGPLNPDHNRHTGSWGILLGHVVCCSTAWSSMLYYVIAQCTEV